VTQTAPDSAVDGVPERQSGDRLRGGVMVGRYRILEPLGRGGMSEVYAAYDPQLDRSVALKIMKHERGHEAHARLQREGRALARLGHRNVVVVHDVGVFDDELFVAMEHVKGESLARWMRAPERTWQDVVAAFVQAADALVTAHAAGVIHRDFKPANVMVERDTERIVVLDFGLARLQDGPTRGSDSGVPVSSANHDATHSAVGTLGYMAPELMDGDGASEATDQFAFCVALYEALYRTRPFHGRHAVELRTAMDAGVPSPDARGDVPRWVHELVLRGLAPDPAARHPSMQSLADALGRRNTGSGRATWWMAGGTVGVLGLAAWVTADATADPCAAAGHAALERAWNDTRRTDARASMLASQRAHASDTADRALARVDRFAATWSDASVDACRRRESSPAAQGHAVQACLDRGLDHLEAAVAVLEDAAQSPSIADRALDLTLSLPPPLHCLDEVALPVGADRTRDDVVSKAIARSVAARVTGTPERASAEANAAVAASDEATPQLRVDALLERSRVFDARADYDAALGDAASALSLATERELPRRQAIASLEMVRLTGDRLRNGDEAGRWETLASATVGRLPPDPALEARRHWVFGTVRWRFDALESAREHLRAAEQGFASQDLLRERAGALTELAMVVDQQGDHGRARALLEEVLSLRQSLYGEGHPAIADTLADMAVVEGRSANTQDALALGERALAIYEERVDPLHPHVATIVMNMGLEYRTQGRHDEALQAFGRAEAIRRQHFGPEHALVADVLNNQAPSLMALQRFDEARVSLLGTLKILEREHGPESAELLGALTNLGNLDVEEGDLGGALEHHTRGHEIALAKLGPEHPSVGIGAHNIGDLWVQRGQCDRARPYFERALAIFEVALGPDAPEVAYPLTALGRCTTEAGHPREAIAMLERALEVRVDHDIAAAQRGETALTLAAAHHAQTPRGPQARQAADLALAAFTEAGQAGREQRAQARAWIDDTLGPPSEKADAVPTAVRSP